MYIPANSMNRFRFSCERSLAGRLKEWSRIESFGLFLKEGELVFACIGTQSNVVVVQTSQGLKEGCDKLSARSRKESNCM